MKAPKEFGKMVVVSPDGDQWARHNYAEPLAKLMAIIGKPGGVSPTDICHDNWCRIYDGGFCNCDPEFVVRNLDGSVKYSAGECRRLLKAGK